MKTRTIFSIKAKFVLTATLLVAIFSISWGSWVWLTEKHHLQKQLETDGKHLLTYLHTRIINTLILEEMGIGTVGELDAIVEEVVTNGEYPAVYAYIVDRHGKILAHNMFSEFGKVYDDPLTRSIVAGGGYMTRITDGGGAGGRILDMSMPLHISGKRWGGLRVGFSMTSMEAELASFRAILLTFSAFFFIAGTIVFYIVGLSMSRPLEHLSEAMREVGPDALHSGLPTPRRDEIGLLQESFHDMLQRLKQSEEERQQALNYLIQNEKMATIGKIVAGVAHEVNNPLAAISTCTYNLERKIPGDLRKYTAILNRGIGRIDTLVSQLRDFSRAGNLDLQKVSSEVFFKEAREFARMVLKNRNIRFMGKDECPPTTLMMDKGKLHQVVLNLLVNAADASPEFGTVALLSHLDGDSYVIIVNDQGEGISPEKTEHIFEIFYTTKPAGEGTGIGLAICKSIVELHNGSIMVASRPGKTAFTVRIPVKSEGHHG